MDKSTTIAELERRLLDAESAKAQLQAALTSSRNAESRLAFDLAALRRIYELNARLANEPDLRVRLEEIIEAANSVLGTDRGCVQLVSSRRRAARDVCLSRLRAVFAFYPALPP